MSYVPDFRDIDKTKLMVVGGKGANLGELARIEGIHVPDGFCVSTEAFKRIIGETSWINELLDQLSFLKVEDREKLGELSSEIRRGIEGIAIPEDINEEITHFLFRLGEKDAFAVRSSATAEDLPTASFAGQHDTYLNIIGKKAILEHISKCWASLFTERAVTYRLQNGFDHRKVHLAVVVQKMVFPQTAGILFTADAITSNRRVLSIDASFGLGEALVSGLVNPDIYKVCDGKVIDKKIATKKLAIHALKDGGTKEQEVEPERQTMQALTDEQVLQLERMGRKVEEHFGRPQDIEWCLVDDTFYVWSRAGQSRLYSRSLKRLIRRITFTYLSVINQMMTDPMKPLGLSFWLLTTRAPMRTAGGRLFVDVAPMLASPVSRQTVINTLGQHDPLIKDALMTIVERKDFIKSLPEEPGPGKSNKVVSPAGFRTQVENDPAIVADLIKSNQKSREELKQNIQTKSGSDLFDFILGDLQQLKTLLFGPQSHIFAGCKR